MSNRILIILLALTLNACASNAGYMGTAEFKTMEECRIARRLGTINDEALFQCAADRLPETIF
jgi:hypothetical protein